MPKMTSKAVDALKAGDKPLRVEVDVGLQLRIATNGIKSWIVRYRIGNERRDYRLPKNYGVRSDDGHMSLVDARNEAARIHALARSGIDVQKIEEEKAAERAREEAAEQARKREEEKQNLAVNDLIEVWLEDGVRRNDSNAALVRSFRADVIPFIGRIPIRELTEHDIRAVLRRIVNAGHNRTAVTTRNYLKQMFTWAQKRQPWRRLLIEGNPMDLIEIGRIVAPGYDLNNQRDRVLSETEIRQLHQIFVKMQSDYENYPDKRFGPEPVAKTTQLAIWIMLSTMCRIGETTLARWEDVDLDSGVWRIPKDNVKDKVARLDVFLSDFTLEQFQALHSLTGHTQFCFPARYNDGTVDCKTIGKQIGDRQSRFKKSLDGSPRKPMKNRLHDNTLVLDPSRGAWTPHDLRRTGATMMQALGVQLDTIDRCQNHVLAGSKVRRHYLHYDYADEKKKAWAELGNRIATILGPTGSEHGS